MDWEGGKNSNGKSTVRKAERERERERDGDVKGRTNRGGLNR